MKYELLYKIKTIKYKKYALIQKDKFDCGATCIQIILNWYSINSDIETLRILSETSRDGTTLKGIQNAFREFKIKAEGFETIGSSELYKIQLPAILHFGNELHNHHFVVLLAIKKNTFILADPAKGIVFFDESTLCKNWESKIILTASPISKDKKNRLKIIPTFYYWLSRFLQTDRHLLFIVTFLSAISSVTSISVNIFSQRIIDKILPSKDLNLLVASTFFLALMFVIRGSSDYFRSRILINQNANFTYNLIASFFSKILKLPYSFFESRRTGDFIARMNDASRIQAAINILFSQVILDILTVLISLIVILFYSAIVSLICLFGVIIAYLLIYFYSFKMSKIQDDVMSSYANSESNFIDTIHGIFTIKNNNKESQFSEMNLSIYKIFQNKILELGELLVKYNLAVEILFSLLLLIVLSVVSFHILTDQTTVGEFVAILGLLSTIIPSVTRLANSNVSIQDAKISFYRMYDYSKLKAEEKDPLQENQFKYTHSDDLLLSVKNLSFGYTKSNPLFSNLNFNLFKGSIIGLSGPSGSGKSTLLKILNGHYPKYNGSIQLNELPLKNIKNSELRNIVGYVSQHTEVFNKSLAFNILLEEPKFSDNLAFEFIKDLGLAPTFTRLKLSTEMQIEEHGANLSGGQKQLIGILRVLYRQPIVLLLDEPFNGMDQELKASIFEALKTKSTQRITLLTSHNDSDLLNCDHIIRLSSNSRITDKPNY
jgi:ATP-binding cassette subfamily B protein